MSMKGNEALEILNNECEDISKVQVALKVAREALAEIQQYRAIGTVEECTELLEYRAIGSVDRIKGSIETNYVLLHAYEEIGTIEEFKALKEKSVAKKPRFYAHNYYCTECGNLVGNNEFEWQRFLYCDDCGQKLDWE